MNAYNVLILEDDSDLSDLLAYNLKSEGYTIFTCADGNEALSTLNDEAIDVAILDVMVPKMSGTEVCRRMRKDERLKTITVLFLSAKTEESDKLVGFMVGGDDYVNKPFSIKEILARIQALLKRSKGAKNYQLGDLVINFERHTVKIAEQRILLAPKEFNVVRLLIEGGHKTLSREMLLEKAWGMDSSSSGRAVDIVITRLRDKLGNYGKCIRTVTGFGYQWDEENITIGSI